LIVPINCEETTSNVDVEEINPRMRDVKITKGRMMSIRDSKERRAINENEEQRNDGSSTRETKIIIMNGRGSHDAVRLERKSRWLYWRGSCAT